MKKEDIKKHLTNWNIWVSENEWLLKPEPGLFLLITASIIIIGTLLAFIFGKEDALPTFYISCIGMMIVYQGSRDAANKLRLELFEKRFEIYEELIKFSSITLQEGKINEDAAQAAHKSFRGLKYHASKFLFGKEIEDYFIEINKAFSGLTTYGPLVAGEPGHPERQQWIDIKYECLRKITSIVDDAPRIFAPYLYFGDIKDVRPH